MTEDIYGSVCRDFGDVDRCDEILSQERSELGKAVLEMAITPPGIVFHEIGIIVQEFSLELMRWHEASPDGLLLEQQFRFLCVNRDLRFFVMIFLRLVFRVALNENSSGNALARLAAAGEVKVEFVSFSIFPSLDIHFPAFCRVMNVVSSGVPVMGELALLSLCR